MRVTFNSFNRQWDELKAKTVEALHRVGESGWYILGKEVSAFELRLSKAWGISHVIGCANGLDAIEMGLRAVGVRPGSKVLTTSLSAFATTLAITRTGGVPVFIDVDESGLIDLDLARKVLSSDPSIKFFVPVHLYGHCLDLKELASLKRDFNLKIVEDCAQSILATSNGVSCGTVGDVATTSFYPTKNLGCIGDGGAAMCNDEGISRTLRSLRDYGQVAKYDHALLGLNSRLDELQAAFLSNFLDTLESTTRKRRATAARYRKGINNRLITCAAVPENSESVWHLFPVLSPERDQLQKFLKEKGIETAVHYPIAIHSQKAMREYPHEVVGELGTTLRFTQQELSLPIHPYLTNEEIDYVIDMCNQWS